MKRELEGNRAVKSDRERKMERKRACLLFVCKPMEVSSAWLKQYALILFTLFTVGWGKMRILNYSESRIKQENKDHEKESFSDWGQKTNRNFITQLPKIDCRTTFKETVAEVKTGSFISEASRAGVGQHMNWDSNMDGVKKKKKDNKICRWETAKR